MIESLYRKFQGWSATGSVYIISDLHFADTDCKLMDKNWITPEEQIQRINNKVRKLDTLVVLGDVGDISYIKKLRAGHKVLIMGNHDGGASNYIRKLEGDMRIDNRLFDEVYEGPLFISEKILLSHEPILGLDFCMNIHGHEHRLIKRQNHLNVAANVCNYEPISLGELIKGGALSKIDTIHRIAINKQIKNKK